jgi:hypothetical protein
VGSEGRTDLSQDVWNIRLGVIVDQVVSSKPDNVHCYCCVDLEVMGLFMGAG